MVNRKLYITSFAVVLLLLTSCGSTRISCNDPNADIYMDGYLIGRGETDVSSMGIPNTAILEAKRGEKVVGKKSMSRQFTIGTFVWGMFTGYTGFIWAWYYPDEVRIPIYYEKKESDDKGKWDKPKESIWDKPIKK